MLLGDNIQPNAILSYCREYPTIELTHGGLECGIISDRCGGLDTISMGPTIRDLHSPEERLYVPSLAKTWEFLKTLLAI